MGPRRLQLCESDYVFMNRRSVCEYWGEQRLVVVSRVKIDALCAGQAGLAFYGAEFDAAEWSNCDAQRWASKQETVLILDLKKRAALRLFFTARLSSA